MRYENLNLKVEPNKYIILTYKLEINMNGFLVEREDSNGVLYQVFLNEDIATKYIGEAYNPGNVQFTKLGATALSDEEFEWLLESIVFYRA